MIIKTKEGGNMPRRSTRRSFQPERFCEKDPDRCVNRDYTFRVYKKGYIPAAVLHQIRSDLGMSKKDPVRERLTSICRGTISRANQLQLVGPLMSRTIHCVLQAWPTILQSASTGRMWSQ